MKSNNKAKKIKNAKLHQLFKHVTLINRSEELYMKKMVKLNS